MLWNERNGMQHVRPKLRPPLGERTNQIVPGAAIDSEGPSGGMEVALQHHGRAVVERVSQSCWRVDPLQTMVNQRQRRKKWRPGAERIDCGSEIMTKTR